MRKESSVPNPLQSMKEMGSLIPAFTQRLKVGISGGYRRQIRKSYLEIAGKDLYFCIYKLVRDTGLYAPIF